MRFRILLLAVPALLAGGLSGAVSRSAAADTIWTGILSMDTVQLLCHRADARYFDYGENGYGCHSSRLMISCRPDLECVSRVRDLNSYMGEPLNTYMRNHGQEKSATTGMTP